MNVADRILDALRAAGNKGLLLDELVFRLDTDKKTVTTTMKRLIAEGQIMQKQELNQTRYFIKEAAASDTDSPSLSDLNGCPCFHCLKISRCGTRQPDSPISCRSLEEWIISANEL